MEIDGYGDWADDTGWKDIEGMEIYLAWASYSAPEPEVLWGVVEDGD